MKLWEYSGKRVKIISTSGRIHVGFVDFYTSELDDPDGVENIAFKPDGTEGYLIDFTESEIASIEILPTYVQATPLPKIAVYKFLKIPEPPLCGFFTGLLSADKFIYKQATTVSVK